MEEASPTTRPVPISGNVDVCGSAGLNLFTCDWTGCGRGCELAEVTGVGLQGPFTFPSEIAKGRSRDWDQDLASQSQLRVQAESFPQFHVREPGRRLAKVFNFKLVVRVELDFARAVQESIALALIVNIQNQHAKLVTF